MVREGRKRLESVRRGSSIGHKCRNMRPEPGVAHQRLSMCWSQDRNHLVTLYFPYHSNISPYLCRSHSNLISLLSRIISLIVLCFHLSSYLHSLLSIWLSLYLLHSVLLFYIPLSSYWMFYSTYPLALFLIVIPIKFWVFLMFLLVDSST